MCEHPERPHYARGLCRSCYNRLHQKENMQATHDRYNNSEKGKERLERYDATEKGKERKRRYARKMK